MRKSNHDLKVELGYLRDNLIEAISEGRTAAVDEGLETYEELVRAFLEMLKRWKAEYNQERTMQELSAFTEEWSEIKWIQSDLREIILAALHSHNLSVIREVSRFPIQLSHIAYAEGDYFIFYKFLNWLPDMYISSVKLLQTSTPEAVEVKKLIVELNWRRLAELCNFVIGPALERAQTKEAVVKQREYAEGVILLINRLLKYAFDTGQIGDFETYRRTLDSLFEHQESEIREISAQRLEWRLSGLQDPGERERVQRQRDIVVARLEAIKALSLMRRLAIFGMNAWILHTYVSEKLGTEECKRWHNNIPSFGSLEEVWELFLKAYERGTVKDFNWDWWELDERFEPGRLMTGGSYIGFSEYLQLLFCIRSLEVLGRTPAQQRMESRLRPSSSLPHLAGGPDSSFFKILSNIERHRTRWEPIIDRAGYEALADFRTILARAVEQQRHADEEHIINAPLSVARISTVKRTILDRWRKTADARHIVKQYGNYEFADPPPERDTYLGYNLTDRKDIYVEDSGISVSDWGKQYGEGLANGENKIFVAKLSDFLQQMAQTPVHVDEVVQYIETALTRLEKLGYSPVIIILNSWLTARALETAKEFSHPTPNAQDRRLLGYYRERPVLNLQYGMDPIIYVVDLRMFAVWRQFRPRLILGTEERIADEITFSVKAYDRQGANELIERQPSLLRDDESGTEKDREEIIRDLLQRVNLRIIEDFEFNVTDQNAGYKIPLADDI